MYDGAIDPNADPETNLRRVRAIEAAGGSARADGQVDGSAGSARVDDLPTSDQLIDELLEQLTLANQSNGAPNTNGNAGASDSEPSSSDEERFEGGGAR